MSANRIRLLAHKFITKNKLLFCDCTSTFKSAIALLLEEYLNTSEMKLLHRLSVNASDIDNFHFAMLKRPVPASMLIGIADHMFATDHLDVLYKCKTIDEFKAYIDERQKYYNKDTGQYDRDDEMLATEERHLLSHMSNYCDHLFYMSKLGLLVK